MALGEAVEHKSTSSLSVTIPLFVKGEREGWHTVLTGTLIHFSPGSRVASVNLVKEWDFPGAI